MKKLGLLTLILAALASNSFGQNSPLVWTKPTGGKNYQLFGIKQPNGEIIGFCRASYQGGIYPGKLVNKKCNIGYGGKEIVLNDFEVFEVDANPNIKINDSWKGSRFQVGQESSGQRIFLCYGIYQNTYQPGKSVDGKCLFTLDGAEIQATSFLNYYYEVNSVMTTAGSPTPTPTPKSTNPTLTEAEKKKRGDGLYSSGVFNFRGDKFEAAVADFSEYLKIFPNSAEVFFNRGVAYAKWGKSALAIIDFEQALKLKPDFPTAKTELDKLKQIKTKEIVTSISQVTDVRPTDEFYGDLQSLIERYGISKITKDRKFNPTGNLTMFEYADFLKQGKEYLRKIAGGFGTKDIDEEKLFNSKCTLPYLEMIPEKEIARSLSCNYRIKSFSMPGGENWVTRGKFAIYFNKAIQQASLEYSLNRQAEIVLNDLFKVELSGLLLSR